MTHASLSSHRTQRPPQRGGRVRGVRLSIAACAILACVLILGCTQSASNRDRPPATTGTPDQARVAERPSPPDPEPVAPMLREVFPHVRFDAAKKLVEFDGEVPIDCHNPKSPRVYLEVTVCTRDSKEHESLVVTDAKPSHVHAALLLAGLEPGTPGRWAIENGQTKKTPASGAAVQVTIAWRDTSGNERTARATEWAVSTSGARLNGTFVFAGSRIVPWQGREYYDADGAGTLIGLTTFGSETIACSELFSPESAVQEPEWIADAQRVPPMGTRVVVRLSAAPRP